MERELGSMTSMLEYIRPYQDAYNFNMIAIQNLLGFEEEKRRKKLLLIC